MRAELTEAGLYVVESDYSGGVLRKPLTYPKVTAVCLSSGETIRVPARIAGSYAPDDQVRLEADIEDEFLGDVAGFIDTFMRGGRSYNCHTFASWMAHGPETKNPLVTRDEVGYTERPLRLREPGFVFTGFGDHSTIGLGDERTIQVMTNNSHIGILTTDEIGQIYGDIPGIVTPATATRRGFQVPKR